MHTHQCLKVTNKEKTFFHKNRFYTNVEVAIDPDFKNLLKRTQAEENVLNFLVRLYLFVHVLSMLLTYMV